MDIIKWSRADGRKTAGRYKDQYEIDIKYNTFYRFLKLLSYYSGYIWRKICFYAKWSAIGITIIRRKAIIHLCVMKKYRAKNISWKWLFCLEICCFSAKAQNGLSDLLSYIFMLRSFRLQLFGLFYNDHLSLIYEQKNDDRVM